MWHTEISMQFGHFLNTSFIPTPPPSPVHILDYLLTYSFMYLFTNLWATWGQRLYVVYLSILSAWDTVSIEQMFDEMFDNYKS